MLSHLLEFFCLISDRDMDPHEARSEHRSKDVMEDLLSSMESDIGIRPIGTRTDDAVDGALQISFLSQAMVSMTCFLVSRHHRRREEVRPVRSQPSG